MLNEYLNELEKKLEERNVSERSEIRAYFEEIIKDRLDNNEDLETILNELGDPDAIVDEFVKEVPQQEIKEKGEEKHLELGNIDDIDIDVVSYNISFLPAQGNTFAIDYEEDSITHLDISNKHGELAISQDYEKFSLGLISMRWRVTKYEGNKPMNAIIYVPQGSEADLDGENVSGNFFLNHVSFSDCNLETVSGDIYIDHSNTADLDLKTVSGDLKIRESQCDDLNFETVSGDVSIYDLTYDEVDIETVSGDVDATLRGSGEDVNVQTLSGECKYRFINE